MKRTYADLLLAIARLQAAVLAHMDEDVTEHGAIDHVIDCNKEVTGLVRKLKREE